MSMLTPSWLTVLMMQFWTYFRRFNQCCESACNKDPVFGVIGIQSGPPGLRVHSGFHESWKPRLGC
jgi:hypothetical protein